MPQENMLKLQMQNDLCYTGFYIVTDNLNVVAAMLSIATRSGVALVM